MPCLVGMCGGVPARRVTAAHVAAGQADAERGLRAAFLAAVGPGASGLLDCVKVLARPFLGLSPQMIGQPQTGPLAGFPPETRARGDDWSPRPFAGRRW